VERVVRRRRNEMSSKMTLLDGCSVCVVMQCLLNIALDVKPTLEVTFATNLETYD